MTSNDDNGKSADKHELKRGIDRVDQLYSLADQAYGGFGESDPAKLQERTWAKKRLSYLTDTNAGALGPISLASPHAWIDHVLTDIYQYARSEQLNAVCECIEIVQLRIRELLNSRP